MLAYKREVELLNRPARRNERSLEIGHSDRNDYGAVLCSVIILKALKTML